MYCFILCFYSFTKLEASCLHAILVTDNVSGEFELMACVDDMQREVKKIASITVQV